jgi:glc operon protein GlcG
MKHRSLAAQMATLVVLAMPATAPAQDLIVETHELTSYAAQRLVEACVAFGEEEGSALAVAVVDADANLLHFHARQGAPGTAILTARLKAETAARWRRPTHELQERVDNNINRAPQWVGDFPRQGGLPIVVNGETIGAIGVGGGGDDVGCGQTAIEAVFGDRAQIAR